MEPEKILEVWVESVALSVVSAPKVLQPPFAFFCVESEADNEKLIQMHFYNHLLNSIIEISASVDLIIHNCFLLR
jgi:hypothetical protein